MINVIGENTRLTRQKESGKHLCEAMIEVCASDDVSESHRVAHKECAA
jgi:hypothetical protein